MCVCVCVCVRARVCMFMCTCAHVHPTYLARNVATMCALPSASSNATLPLLLACLDLDCALVRFHRFGTGRRRAREAACRDRWPRCDRPMVAFVAPVAVSAASVTSTLYASDSCDCLRLAGGGSGTQGVRDCMVSTPHAQRCAYQRESLGCVQRWLQNGGVRVGRHPRSLPRAVAKATTGDSPRRT